MDWDPAGEHQFLPDFGLMDAWGASVTASSPPRQVYALASASLLFGIILFASGVISAASGQSIGVISASGALVLTLRAIRTLSTRMTEAGVSQLTWGGRVHLSWNEVTRVTRTSLSFTLIGNKKRVVLSVEELQDTAAAISYIESRLPSNLGSD